MAKINRAKLLFMCGKMAAGKSTLARALAARENAVLFVEDQLLEQLFPGEITDIPTYVKRAPRVKDALAPYIHSLLGRGVSVMLDFPGNTRNQRAWFRRLLESAGVEHELHFVDASDASCKRQLKQRSQGSPEGSAWTSEAEFAAVTAYFEPPSADEGFNVIRHQRD